MLFEQMSYKKIHLVAAETLGWETKSTLRYVWFFAKNQTHCFYFSTSFHGCTVCTGNKVKIFFALCCLVSGVIHLEWREPCGSSPVKEISD